MNLCEAIAVAKRRGRAIKRRHWSDSGGRIVVAADGLWRFHQPWIGGRMLDWTVERWQASYEDLVSDTWETCRP